jgi:hypothetical protein
LTGDGRRETRGAGNKSHESWPTADERRGTRREHLTNLENQTNRGKLSIKNQRPKYQITHPSSRIASTDDVVLRVHYNVQPWVGALTWDQGRDYGKWKAMAGGASDAFALPALKKKDTAGDGKKKANSKAKV